MELKSSSPRIQISAEIHSTALLSSEVSFGVLYLMVLPYQLHKNLISDEIWNAKSVLTME